jgi:hypothetical protein
MVIAAFLAAAVFAQGQATVRIHSPAIVRPAEWRPATNPRQHERRTTEQGRPVLLRITDYE